MACLATIFDQLETGLNTAVASFFFCALTSERTVLTVLALVIAALALIPIAGLVFSGEEIGQGLFVGTGECIGLGVIVKVAGAK